MDGLNAASFRYRPSRGRQATTQHCVRRLMDQIQTIINRNYEAFADIPRPPQFTDFEHCDECFEHNETMQKAGLRTLEATAMGTAGWSPLSFLTEQGLSYYMPRLLELALNLDKNEHDESFLSHFLFHLVPTEDYDRFANYSHEQCKTILESLRFALSRHRDQIVEEFIQEDIEAAIEYWQRKTTCSP